MNKKLISFMALLAALLLAVPANAMTWQWQQAPQYDFLQGLPGHQRLTKVTPFVKAEKLTREQLANGVRPNKPYKTISAEKAAMLKSRPVFKAQRRPFKAQVNYATITLTAGDVWFDGSGYQMLLDADATAYGDIIPESGPLTESGDASEEVYAQFEYKIPENADGSLTTENIVLNSSVTIEVPAGTYDWCITNPTADDRMWIASQNGDVGGRQDDYVFEAGHEYEFVVSLGGNGNDQVDLFIDGESIGPDPVEITPIDELPYSNSFDSSEEYTQVSVLDSNEDGYTFNLTYEGEENTNIAAYLQYSKDENDNDDWLYFPPIWMEAGRVYSISFDARCTDADYPETFEVKAATSSDALPNGLTVLGESVVESVTFENFVNPEFVVKEDGYYYIGIHNYTVYDNAYYFFVDNFLVEDVTPEAPEFNYEAIAIDPYPGEVKELEEFVITFGDQSVTIDEDAVVTLTKPGDREGEFEIVDEGLLELRKEGGVLVVLSDKVTASGVYTLNIDKGSIFYNGESLVPLSFGPYRIAMPDYEINPVEGTYDKLENFTITFNNYMVEGTDGDEVIVTFANLETSQEQNLTGYVIGGKSLYITLGEEFNINGNYALTVPKGQLRKTLDGEAVAELYFEYTIEGGVDPVEEDALVVLPEGVEPEDWTIEGQYKTSWGSQDVLQPTKVAFDGNDVYVQGLFFDFPDSWAKGTIAEGKAVFAPQLIGDFPEYGEKYYLVGSEDGTTVCDIVFAYDTEAQTLIPETPYVYLNYNQKDAVNEEYLSWWEHLKLYAGAPIAEEPVTPPADLASDTWKFRSVIFYSAEDSEEYDANVQVGFDGDDVYIQGIAPNAPQLWIKATKNADGKYVVPALQFMGETSGWFKTKYYFAATDGTSTLEDVVLDFDVETNTITTEQWLVLNRDKYALNYMQMFQGATFFLPAPVVIDELPYANSFDSADKRDEMKVIDANGDDVTWRFEEASASYGWHGSNSGDDWLVTPMIRLEAGKTYSFSIDAWRSNTNGTESFEVKLAKEATAEALAAGVQVIENQNVEPTEAENYSNMTITVEEDGYYYFGIHCTSPADQYGMSVTNLLIDEVPVFNPELIAIDPAEGQVEELYNFTISFGDQKVTVKEDAQIQLVDINDEVVAEAGIELNEDGSVSIGLEEAVTADGVYWLNIPDGAICFNGAGIGTLSYRYFIGDAEANIVIDPEEGEVESLGIFHVMFKGIVIDLVDPEAEVKATLVNEDSGRQYTANILVIANRRLYVPFTDVTEAGHYTMTIPAGTVVNDLNGLVFGELTFQYVINGKPDYNLNELVELPDGIESQTWTIEGVYNAPDEYGEAQSTNVQHVTGVAFDGDFVYIQGLAYYFPEAWVKGKLEGNTVTIPVWQFVGEDDYGREYLAGTKDGSAVEDIVFIYDAEAQTLTMQTPFILENDGNEEVGYWGYWHSVILYAGEPQVLEPVEAPADLATETYIFKANAVESGHEDEGAQPYEAQVKVGFDGDDVYIQGLSPDMPDLWVKATKNEAGQYVIPANQYMGELSFWGYTFPYFFTAVNDDNTLADVVLNYDPETSTFTTDQIVALNGDKKSLYYYLLFGSVVITKMEEVAATPADPTFEEFNISETVGYSTIYASVPTVDTEGNTLLTDKLYYIIWIEKDGVAQPYTFTADLYSVDFTEDVTEVPWTLDGYDIYRGGEIIYLEDEIEELQSWTKVGIQSVYYGAGERNVSNIVWNDGSSTITTGIDAITADSDARYFDMQGRAVERTHKGLVIKQTRDANGHIQTQKVVRK